MRTSLSLFLGPRQVFCEQTVQQQESNPTLRPSLPPRDKNEADLSSSPLPGMLTAFGQYHFLMREKTKILLLIHYMKWFQSYNWCMPQSELLMTAENFRLSSHQQNFQHKPGENIPNCWLKLKEVNCLQDDDKFPLGYGPSEYLLTEIKVRDP
jgi:hypothetical protein